MKTRGGERVWWSLVSVAVMIGLYTLASNAYRLFDLSLLPDWVASVLRPASLPPPERLLDALVQLVGGEASHAGGSGHVGYHLAGAGTHGATLQGSLLVSTYRVVVGVCVGAPLGVLTGLLMGWSARVDAYVHPIYILVRSVPPLSLITYIMLWLGHGETHLLVPVVYAVFATLVIPTYHGVRDVAEIYVKAARAMGARGPMLLGRVVLPAASPLVLAGLRHGLIIAWMTAVGAEMLMADRGIGALLVGGGLWTSRLTIAVDPAVVMVSLLSLATVGYLMDGAARLLAGRLTGWTKGAER